MADNNGSGIQSTTTAGGTADAEARRKALADWYAAHPESAPDAVKTAQDNATPDIGSRVSNFVTDSVKNFATAPIKAPIDAVKGNWGAVGADLANTATLGTASPTVGLAHDAGAPVPTVPGYGGAGSGKEGGSSIGSIPGVSGISAPGANPTSTADAAAARASRDQLLNQYENPATRPAPTTTAPTVAPVTKVAPTTVGPATAIAPTTVGAASQAGAAPTVSAPQIAATTVGPAATYSASTIAPTAGAQASQVQAATIDQGQQQQVRERQLKLLDSLEQSANGTGGPSAAEAQFRKSTDEAIATQQGLVAGARGTGRSGAQWQAANQIAQIQGKAGADAAILRAQEQQKARDQLLQGYEGTRGADVTVAGKQADLTQGANLLGAQLGTNVSISNADREAARSMKQADLEQAAAAGNAAAKNELASRQAQITSTESIAGAGNALDASKANAGNAVTVDVANMQAKNRMQELQAQITSQQGIATAEQQNELTKLQAQISSTANVTDANNTNDLAKVQAQATLQTNIANLDAQLKARGLDDTQRIAQLNAYTQQQADLLGWDKSEAANAIEKYKADQELKGAIVGGGGALLAGLLKSDERTKKDITHLYSDDRGKKDKKALLDSYDGGHGEVEALLDALHPVKFKYKDPKSDGAAEGERFGIVAQDLEKSPMGRSLVVEDQGVKKVDTAQAVGAILAAMARMNTRVKRVEGKRA